MCNEKKTTYSNLQDCLKIICGEVRRQVQKGKQKSSFTHLAHNGDMKADRMLPVGWISLYFLCLAADKTAKCEHG